ncbi:MAG: GerMN domain-containing protein [Leptospira sp.]|nr:GerMN domain-containing protein [Leptospira sp.]
MAPLPPQPSDKLKSLSYMIGGLLFVLVLIEKSLGFSGGTMPANWSKESFRNLGNSSLNKNPTFSERTNDPFLGNEWEDDLAWEEEALENTIPITNTTSVSANKQKLDDSNSIPEVTLPEDTFRSSGNKLQESPAYLPIYFLKFYGQGKNSQSQLVKVIRQFPGGDPISFILSELLRGPSPEEKTKGVLNSLPKRIKFDTNYKLDEGILHVSFSKELEFGGSPEILKDRLDQICYSLIGNFGIKGVILYVGNKRLRSLGGDGMSLPDVLVKNSRKVILF